MPLLWLLCSCSSLPSSTLTEWQRFSQQIDQLNVTELAVKQNELLQAYNSKPSDQSRLYLSYVLSRPQSLIQNLAMSRQLLGDIEADSLYSPLAVLLQEHIDQKIELAAHSSLMDWGQFVEEIARLEPPSYVSFRDQLLLSYKNSPDDEIRLRLGYLLSRPNTDIQNLPKSVELLAEIERNSSYLWLRTSLLNEINLMRELRAANAELNSADESIDELQTQLKMLKTIDGDLTESQREIDEISQ